MRCSTTAGLPLNVIQEDELVLAAVRLVGCGLDGLPYISSTISAAGRRDGRVLTRCFRSYVLDCPMKYYSMVPDKAV
jgi:hypothetical protein